MPNLLVTWFSSPRRRPLRPFQFAEAVTALEDRQLLSATTTPHPHSEKVQPHSVPPKDFSGKWNMTSDVFSTAKIDVQQIGRKSTAVLRLGDVNFDVNAKIKGDQYVGKFKKTILDTRYTGRIDVALLNPTTFVGTIVVKASGSATTNSTVNGTHV
ncbi:MAG: hypothetical protein U0903_20720 [Planctomycetales bacterium]